jgi:hypothetical protein
VPASTPEPRLRVTVRRRESSARNVGIRVLTLQERLAERVAELQTALLKVAAQRTAADLQLSNGSQR